MHFRPSLSPRAKTWLILALLAAFVVAGCARYSTDTGDDLAASYIGCRLIASGDSATHLYAYDPDDFSAVGEDDEWQAAADDGHFESWLHPYVQTPLWAWSLQPLCRRLAFPAFDRLFDLLTLLSFSALIWLVARHWTHRLFHPVAIAPTLLVLFFSMPFRYAMTLMQTHIFFILLTVAALLCAQRRRPYAAGTLLALAAAVKLTPAIFLVYWLLTRRYRAAATFVAVSAVLLLAAIVATGRPLFAEYLATLHRVSGTLLLSQNNQSLAAWWMGHFYPASEVAQLRILPLPATLGLVSSALILLSALGAGLIDRRPKHPDSPPAPLGALFLLIAATAFTPIAWTHYFIVLLPALMVLLDIALRRRSLSLVAAIMIITALNLQPLASDVIDITVGPYAVLRGQFFAGLLGMAALAVVALSRDRYTPTRPALT